MKGSLLIGVVLVVSTIGVAGSPSPAGAQLRLQETPALYGWGHLLKDVQVRFDAGVGNTSTTSNLEREETWPQAGSAWFWGIYVDKPISAVLDVGYDLVWWEREFLPRDTFWREVVDTVRIVAFYRQGDFFVSGQPRKDEFYVGTRLVFDLGRLGRHFAPFQR